MKARLTKHTNQEHGTSIANFLPSGAAFGRKFDEKSELKKLLNGFGGELGRQEDAIKDYYDQRDINETIFLIEEWERALGIPDDCFNTNVDLATRRGQVIIKLAFSPQVAFEFEDLAKLLGYQDVVVTALTENFLLPLDVPFVPFKGIQGFFTVLVTGTGIVTNLPPYDVPFPLSSDASLIQCVFDKLKPANVRFIYAERI